MEPKFEYKAVWKLCEGAKLCQRAKLCGSCEAVWILGEDAKLCEGAKLREDAKLYGSCVKQQVCVEAV
jgi:hypothetical protein